MVPVEETAVPLRAHSLARVFISGRTIASVDAVAADIVASGGAAETAQLDALDEEATNECVDGAMRKTGKIDVSF